MKYCFLFFLIYIFNSVNAQVCNSALFDGISDGIKIECPLVANEPSGWSLNEFTYDFWIKCVESEEIQTIFSFSGKDLNGNGCHFNRGYVTASGFFKFSGDTEEQISTPNDIFSTNQVNNNQWHHIAITRESDMKIRLYVNGLINYVSNSSLVGNINIFNEGGSSFNLDDQCNGNPAPWNTIGYQYSVGGGTWNSQSILNGKIDNFRVWGNSFSENEINDLINNCELILTEPIMYLPFDNLENGEFDDIVGGYLISNYGASQSTDNPICCDCDISSSEISACKGSMVDVTTNSIFEPLWDDGSNSIVYSPLIFSDTTISVIFLDSGNVICEDSIFISVINPIVPEITQVGTTLLSSTALFYQWYYEGVELDGENSQSITDISSGNYSVYTKDENGCYAISESFLVQADESWDCLNNECVDLGQGSGIYSSLEECKQQCHSSTNINEFIDTREIKGIYNIYGQKATSSDKIQIIIYKNGSVSKQIKSN